MSSTSSPTAREIEVAAALIAAVQGFGGATWSLREAVGQPEGLPQAGYLVSMPGRSLTLRGYETTGKLPEIVTAWLTLHRTLLQVNELDTVRALDALGELLGPQVGWTPTAPLGPVFAGAWWDDQRGTTVFDVNVLITSDAHGVPDNGRHRAINTGWFWGEHSIWRIVRPDEGEEILCGRMVPNV